MGFSKSVSVRAQGRPQRPICPPRRVWAPTPQMYSPKASLAPGSKSVGVRAQSKYGPKGQSKPVWVSKPVGLRAQRQPGLSGQSVCQGQFAVFQSQRELQIPRHIPPKVIPNGKPKFVLRPQVCLLHKTPTFLFFANPEPGNENLAGNKKLVLPGRWSSACGSSAIRVDGIEIT